MTGGFPEVKVISFGLHKHRHGCNVRVEKIVFVLFFSPSPKTRRHHVLASVEVVPLHCSDYDYDDYFHFYYRYDYDGNDLYVFLKV